MTIPSFDIPPAPVDICNFALSLVNGALATNNYYVESLDADPNDPNTNIITRALQLTYPRARNKMQSIWEGFPLERFAKMGSNLDTDSQQVAPNWLYQYLRPACLSFRGIVTKNILPGIGEWQEEAYLEIGNNIASNVLNDDSDPQYLFRFNILLVDTTQWPEGLIQSVGHLLAVYLARPLGLSQPEQAHLLILFKDAWADARTEQQKRVFVPDRKAQRGLYPELSPGIQDFNFPQPS